MTTIKLTGGILGRDQMMVRTDMARSESPVEVDYCEGSGWVPTQYQCADTRHRTAGLIRIGRELARSAVQQDGTCDAIELD